MPKRIPTGLKIAVINRMFRKKLDEKAEEMGLTSSQLRVLGTISHLEEDGKHEIHQNDLERTERVSHPAMTKMLQRLENGGYITSTRCQKDKRYKIIACTDKAKGIHKTILEHDKMVFEEICRTFTEEQRNQIEYCLDLLFGMDDSISHERHGKSEEKACTQE